MDVAPATAILRCNERLKLIAAALNSLALAFVVAGYVGPVVTGAVPGNPRAVVTLAWLAIGLALHRAGYWDLGRLE